MFHVLNYYTILTNLKAIQVTSLFDVNCGFLIHNEILN